MCYFYLFEFYAVHKLYKEAAEYGRTYLKYKKQLKLRKRFNTSIYYGMARNYMELKDYKHAEEMFTQGLKEIPGDLDLSFGLTEFGVRCQRPDLTTIGARQYLNLYQKYRQKPSTRSSNFMYSFMPENRIYVMINLILAQLNEAYNYLQKVKPMLQTTQKEFRDKVIKSFIKDTEKIGLDQFIQDNLDIQENHHLVYHPQQSKLKQQHYLFN